MGREELAPLDAIGPGFLNPTLIHAIPRKANCAVRIDLGIRLRSDADSGQENPSWTPGQVGPRVKIIVEEEQAGQERSEHGKRVIEELSRRLQDEFAKGYDRSKPFAMTAFFLTCPKVNVRPHQ